jgi:hypothetical protein
MIQDLPIDAAHAAALARWQAPFPGFTSGHDPRTSDNALLALLYGGLANAADHEWLNAGRRLIDKTYIDMLWHVQALTDMRTCRPEQIAAALDSFVLGTVSSHWVGLTSLASREKEILAIHWVEEVARTCFGSLHSEPAASRLLFYLCPMLPVFNLSRGHLHALDELGHGCANDSYAAYALSANAAYRRLMPSLSCFSRPSTAFGNPVEQALIQRLLQESDWWPRRIFDALLLEMIGSPRVGDRSLFACDDSGQMMP